MKDLTASLQARLKNTAREQRIPYNTLLEHFALGRLFARISVSDYADKLVLKGAQLFRIWSDTPHRPTRDADFLSFGESEAKALAAMFDQICALDPEEDDALAWLPAEAAPIREENAYGGVRVKCIALLGNIRIPLQIDIGFGDAITPASEPQTWKSLLDFEDVALTAYPVETVIAEKLEAMVSLGMANSRMKDFFDLLWISQHCELEFTELSRAVANTFQRRETALPTNTPIALTEDFSGDESKNTQWRAFLRKSKLPPSELSETVEALHAFLSPLLVDTIKHHKWSPFNGWK